MCTIAGAKVQRNYNCYNVYFYECLRFTDQPTFLRPDGSKRQSRAPSQEGFEPFPKPFSNHSCVPLVASGKAEREQGLIDSGQRPPFVKVLVWLSSLCPFGVRHDILIQTRTIKGPGYFFLLNQGRMKKNLGKACKIAKQFVSLSPSYNEMRLWRIM